MQAHKVTGVTITAAAGVPAVQPLEELLKLQVAALKAALAVRAITRKISAPYINVNAVHI